MAFFFEDLGLRTHGNTRGAIISPAFEYVVLFLAAIPFIYYLLAIYSSIRFFGNAPPTSAQKSDFTPPISNLKPVRGLDPEAYENFASFCRQDYPDYELLFCVHDQLDPAVPVLQKLMQDFPDRKIRILYGSGRNAINDKVSKLVRLVNEAENELLVINDSDVRVRPDYFRTVVAPLKDPKVGGVTCLYLSVDDTTTTQAFQSIGMISDFYPGVMVAWLLDGVKFAFGQTIVTTRTLIAGFGGFQALESRPADDLLTGRLIAQQGVAVEMLPYAVRNGGGLPVPQWTAGKAFALDDRHAPHAPVGPRRLGLHPGFGLVVAGCRRASHLESRGLLSRHVFLTASGDDYPRWRVGPA